MKTKTFLLLLLLSASTFAFSQDRFTISILTCSPGREVYSVFGHSSMRVIDRQKGTDQVYNFGIFDFDTPNFAYKFLKGKLQYSLGIQQTPRFIQIYTSENRLVSEQVLDLTKEEEIVIVRRLNYLYLPGNRFYYYSFLNKNCSTELRDLLVNINVIHYGQEMSMSNRELINPYLNHIPWMRLGANMLMGTMMDRHSDDFQSMFLPDYLKSEVNQMTLNGNDIVQNESNLNPTPEDLGTSYQKIFSPLRVFSALFLILIFWRPKSVQIALCSLIGIVGLLLGLLWIFSGHPEIRNNLDILWCNPLYLLYIPLLIRNKKSKALAYTLFATLILTVIIWLSGVQQFDIAVIPLMLILGLINYKARTAPPTRHPAPNLRSVSGTT
ncbi:DUF4105 domain-containing protein [Roseivirga sp. E12]|uniref:lipoprotein N-acyltransferase Lnb domain-containing protein n=1 Tax=Roseivirga sp. E12 TaxID=2819237 RepID=UPI001ABCD074|nr:DUF4105 domain-containing protein [Roseivirga sp. E12]MBO3697169.1 DUF4105 domain-containing protein [Roseivirga sp. E12]